MRPSADMDFLLCYPGFKRKAVTFSYDDGVIQDVEVVLILKKHRMKGTFNLNPGLSGNRKYRMDLSGKEIDCSYLDLKKDYRVYEGMEVSNHTFSHPHLEDISYFSKQDELERGRLELEEIFHNGIYGFAYPYGTYDEGTLDLEKRIGVEYARTTRSTYSFSLPYRWDLWNPTVHHRDKKIFDVIDEFLKSRKELALLYIWGHGYEFALDHNFDLLDDICDRLSSDDVVCLTNHEVYVYVRAASEVYYSKREKAFVNPSDMDVYLMVDDQKIMVPKRGVYQYENQ